MEEVKKYYGQQCQDEKINIAFRNLHKNLVNEIIGFCKAWGISIDEIHLNADCLEDSIKAGSWQPCTDSCFILEKFSDDYKKAFLEIDKEFLLGKTKKDLDMIRLKEEPYLRSM